MHGQTREQCSQNNFQPIPYEEGTKEYDRTMSKLDGTFTGPDLVVNYDHLKETEPPATEAPQEPPAGGSTEAPADPPADTPADPPADAPADST